MRAQVVTSIGVLFLCIGAHGTVLLRTKQVLNQQADLITKQTETINTQDVTLKRLSTACHERVAAADDLTAEMRRGIEARDRVISQLRGGR